MKRVLFVVMAAAVAADLPAQGVIHINPDKDNTLYQSSTGTISNGAGVAIFSGLTNMNKKRRALIHFDVAGNVPAGATVVGATLVLEMNQTAGGPLNIDVRRVLADWGEGTSAPAMGNGGSGAPATTGDATWLHRFYPSVYWTAQGGDFSAVVSATTSVWQGGIYTWSSAQLTADVQNFLNNPAGNFGWMLKSPEVTIGDAKRFASREEVFPPSWPRLEITYLAPPSASVTNAGYGCNGLMLSAIGLPRIGNTAFAFDVSGGVPGATAFVIPGNGIAPVPISLGGGCFFDLDPASAIAYVNAGLSLGPVLLDNLGHATLAAPIPPAGALHGFSICVQCVAVTPALTSSNVLSLVLGS